MSVVILGIYVTDLAFRAQRMPLLGETVAGSAFAMGPGGKGSNQAVAAARAGADVIFCTRIGNDAFGQIAQATWAAEGIASRATVLDDIATGAAHIYVDENTGGNAIIVAAGAAGTLGPEDVEAIEADIARASVFVTQLEQPLPAARRGLELARKHGVTTVFNPAPALPLTDDIYPLCDYITPNETEATALTGVAIESVDDARRAADVLLKKGARAVIVTLGEKGALLHTSGGKSELVPAFDCGRVVETAGAGDGFTGGFAAALARGDSALAAVRFGCALASLSVTRAGTAPSMPRLDEINAVLGERSEVR
ncbi:MULTISPECIES: ribokinase [unclassified Caballeronia]|jgi:ribokinase|uniref:ribokinase n=1 Tax=unclassified Caballeronia TaxID=2646786 RepID=UPI00202783D1|nr:MULTISPECIES: ribokinase [unclassified Caballeronia]MDR5805963.1 ribokinase [Caballeronia sp. LZ001]